MSISNDYKRQFEWRDWPAIFAALPPLRGQTVLDLGCGVGDLSAELAARGARVIGVDTNEDLLQTARKRRLPGVELHSRDLRAPLALGARADGMWCSFAAAYFPDLTAAVERWAAELAPGGWCAITEIDDLFGHEPLGARTKALFDGYARESLAAGRYDFHMGGKLGEQLSRAGFAAIRELTVGDRELSFDGPASADVLEAWRTRLQRMKLLRDFCGPSIDEVEAEFLACLVRPDHRSTAKICCYIGARRG
jgi:SAM-dependent methyltransferase